MAAGAQNSGLEKIQELEELVEERTNRSLRQTLVFKGIPENKTDNGNDRKTKKIKPESWAETTDTLAGVIADICDTNFASAKEMINRAHRSAPKEGDGPRDIFANLYCWSDCENITKSFRFYNMENPGYKIYANYKYGRLTTMRRNEALKLRKELKASNEITQGYIQYPARLMVKHGGEETFRCHRDFSKEKVIFKRKSEDK